jgi:dihydrofolate reductase
MRKLIATEYLTLDGVMEAPGDEPSLGERGGWSFLFSSEEYRQFKFEELLASDALLMGRMTYEIFAAAWPSRTGEFADRMNSLPKYVVSKTLQKAEWNNSHLINDAAHVVEKVIRLKRQPGRDILLCGSADLLHTLRQHQLIDEYRFMVYPILLGTGKRLFKEGDSVTLDLVKSQMLSSGVVVLIYHPHGKNNDQTPSTKF